MGIASEMKELTRNIATSHKDRRMRIDEIREEVNQARGEAQSLIMGFEAFRQETNQRLRKDLAQDKAHRKSETRGILKEAQDILKGFEASRKETNTQLRRDLSQGTAAIRSEVSEMLGQAQKLIKGFGTSRQTVNSKLRKDLSRSRVKSKSEVGKLLGNAQSLVKGFQTSRREAGSRLRGDLAQSRASMESDVKRMRSDFRKVQGNVKTDLKEARAAWQGLAGTIQARKSGKAIQREAEAPAAKEGYPDFETKMLAAVNEHPEGMTLSGIADIVGVAPIVLGRAVKSLQDKGEIRKNGKFYFPVVNR
jgi:uncharacterized protein YicC (UPF0701 family)